MEKFRVESFWKEQLNGAATRLPEESFEAESLKDAIEKYIGKHYPFLGLDDYGLVRLHTKDEV